jgi:hypothetical protein
MLLFASKKFANQEAYEKLYLLGFTMIFLAMLGSNVSGHCQE